MSTAPRDIVIVGGGLAAAKAAETLRGDGYDGRVSILAEESERPYERPPLSKGVLVHEAAPEEVYVHPADFYAEHGIALRLGDPAVQIDRDAGAVLTRSGQRLHFDRLLIATGAFPRELPLGDENLDGVLTLRTLGDSRRLSARLQAAEHATVVGAGWIGCEVAAAARALGTELTMVDPLDVPLERVLGRRIGQVFADLHTDHGVDLRTGVSVSGAQGNGTVEQITLTDGTTIDTQLVIVGIGVIPRVELAEAAGLTIDDGIVVDATLASTDPRILAAGTSPGPSTPRSAEPSEWSAGRTPSTKARPPEATSSAPANPTTACPTSTPTNTTSAWSTPATPRAGTTSSSAAPSRTASSSPSGCARDASSLA